MLKIRTHPTPSISVFSVEATLRQQNLTRFEGAKCYKNRFYIKREKEEM